MFEVTQNQHDTYTIAPDNDSERQFTAEIDGTEIELAIVAQIDDMRELLSDNEIRRMGVGEYIYTLSVWIVPTAEHTDIQIKEKVLSTYGTDLDDIDYLPHMTVEYGYGVPVNPESISRESEKGDIDLVEDGKKIGFTEWDDAEQYVNEYLPKKAVGISGLVGFYLDNRINRIGETGWDRLTEVAIDPDYDGFQAALNRNGVGAD